MKRILTLVAVLASMFLPAAGANATAATSSAAAGTWTLHFTCGIWGDTSADYTYLCAYSTEFAVVGSSVPETHYLYIGGTQQPSLLDELEAGDLRIDPLRNTVQIEGDVLDCPVSLAMAGDGTAPQLLEGVPASVDPDSKTALLGIGWQREQTTSGRGTLCEQYGMDGPITTGFLLTITFTGAAVDAKKAPAPEHVAAAIAARLEQQGARRPGMISGFAGTGAAGASGDGGPALNATLNSPARLATGADGTVYVADRSANRVRRVSADGTISTLATNVFDAHGLAVGPDGVVYVSNGSWITAYGPNYSYTVAGTGWNICWTDPRCGDEGPAYSADFESIGALAAGPDGTLFIADEYQHRIRRVTPDGIIHAFAGGLDNGTCYGPCGDGGPASAARFSSITDLDVDADGAVYILDGGRVRRVDPAGTITTLIGGSGSVQPVPPVLPFPRSARVYVEGIGLGPDGTLYLTDLLSKTLRALSPSGVLTTVAGGPAPADSGDGGPALAAGFAHLADVASGADGALIVADDQAHRLRRIEVVGASA